MRRAAAQALRTARRSHFRKLFHSKSSPFLVQNPRRPTTLIRRNVPLQIVHSSIFFRNFSVAAVASVIASGLWYYQQDSAQDPNSGSVTHGPSSLSSIPSTATTQLSITPQSKSFLPSSTEAPSSSIEPVPNPYAPLLVDNENFFLAELAEEAPLTKKVEKDGDIKMEKLSPEQATRKLRHFEQSYSVGRGRGVLRYDINKIPSNNPIEDDHAEKIVEIPSSLSGSSSSAADINESSDWMFFGVFDGHSGWTTSAKLRQRLISYVARELSSVHRSSSSPSPAPVPSVDPTSPTTLSPIEEAIKRGFLALDNDIVHNSARLALSGPTKLHSTDLLAPALSGACALLSFYDTRTSLLRVACTGDSRAVLGRRSRETGKWTATALSEDQTGGTPSEIARLRKEHPGEPEVTMNGRILGQLEPSRAFGDASYKWPRKVQEEIKKRFFGRTPASRLKTPPYVTAEPVVTTTKIEPGQGDFVVLATDGLWEMLTNEEVVGLVGRWLEKQENPNPSSGPIAWAKSFTSRGSEGSLPVEKPAAVKGDDKGQRGPIRQSQYDLQPTDDRFVTEDKNVATHLVRNALGGKDNDLVCSLLSLVSPYSRRYRDDLTVEVIFFGEEKGEKSGHVVLNPEASNPGAGLKAKL